MKLGLQILNIKEVVLCFVSVSRYLLFLMSSFKKSGSCLYVCVCAYTYTSHESDIQISYVLYVYMLYIGYLNYMYILFQLLFMYS